MCQSLSCKCIHLHIHLEERVHNTPLREILLQYPFKWLRVFSVTMRTKTNLTNTGLENSTTAPKWADYGNTALTSKPTCTELDQPVCPCDAEEVDQKIVNHA